MKKIVLTVVLVVSIVAIASAQDYKNGVGLRGGLFYGITLKHFLGEKAAVEGLLQNRESDFDITALYEIHAPAFEVDKLRWYYGGGAHVGGNKSGLILGIDGVLGIEYTFSEAPIVVGVDWKPAINIIGSTKIWPDGGGLSIRYTF